MEEWFNKEEIDINELKQELYFYSFFIICIIGLILSPIMTVILAFILAIGQIAPSFDAPTMTSFAISFIIGLASIIISHIWMDKDGRLFYTRIIGLLTIILGILTLLALYVPHVWNNSPPGLAGI